MAERYRATRVDIEHLRWARLEELLTRREGSFDAANAFRDYADRFERAAIAPSDVEWADRGLMKAEAPRG